MSNRKTQRFLPQALIRKKRDGVELSSDEVRALVAGVTDGSIADYQVSAMLMAIFFRGMTDAELATFADAMLHSGDVLDLSSIDRPKVDKHSTGGVGDKISLPLAAAVAACGVAVPMVSGRGLGHTGGTLDKLESIPGFSVNLTADQFREQVDRVGVCLIGQTKEIAPADKRLYALRDVTATVESIPLIASSIMSKKLAEGIDALVLDCKVGNGAFMKREEDARKLAKAIRAIGAAASKPVHVVLTDMNAPIGRAIGNAVEVEESIATMRGEGPVDTHELTCVLGGEMLMLAGIESDESASRQAIDSVLRSGKALDVFTKLIEAQGGDPAVTSDPSRLPGAKHTVMVTAEQRGTLTAIAARDIGVAALRLGAGRTRTDEAIDHGVGIVLQVRVGESVDVGQPLAELRYNDRAPEAALELAKSAFQIAEESPFEPTSRIISVIR